MTGFVTLSGNLGVFHNVRAVRGRVQLAVAVVLRGSSTRLYAPPRLLSDSEIADSSRLAKKWEQQAATVPSLTQGGSLGIGGSVGGHWIRIAPDGRSVQVGDQLIIDLQGHNVAMVDGSDAQGRQPTLKCLTDIDHDFGPLAVVPMSQLPAPGESSAIVSYRKHGDTWVSSETDSPMVIPLCATENGLMGWPMFGPELLKERILALPAVRDWL